MNKSKQTTMHVLLTKEIIRVDNIVTHGKKLKQNVMIMNVLVCV